MKIEEIKNKIGKTPLIQLKAIEEAYDLKAHLFAKIESKNPFGSVKDRIAYQMIMGKIEEGVLNQDTTLIEPTSGNT